MVSIEQNTSLKKSSNMTTPKHKPMTNNSDYQNGNLGAINTSLAQMGLRKSEGSMVSFLKNKSFIAAGSILNGKQEHYMKRELISQQVQWEISELSHPTALQRFGSPFRSDAGEVSPKDSELPILRFIFNNHIRNFPFLDQAREKEFWQDKLQVFLESFATKSISSSEDRLEQTKRRRLALKAQKLIELMMVSGIPTASGYEERIRFAEIEVVDRGAKEQGLVANTPQGKSINGWDVNVASVRTTSVKRHIRHHQRAEFIIRTKRESGHELYVGRRYSDFVKLHRKLRVEVPGKIVPPLPKRNKSNVLMPDLHGNDNESISSISTEDAGINEDGNFRSYFHVGTSHKRRSSDRSVRSYRSPRVSLEGFSQATTLYREAQRVTLRAFLRTLLQVEKFAQSKAMAEFLTFEPIILNEEELADVAARAVMDEKRLEEQRQFFEIAQRRARELDVHMEKFRREIVEAHGLTNLFQEIRLKKSIAELKPEYQKFAEWLRIEVAAILYHLFLAEDNSPELFGLAKRIHSLLPYGLLKNVIRVTNPAAVMSGVLNLFLAQPFGTRSLMQRILIMAISDSVTSIQKSIDALCSKIEEPLLCARLRNYVYSDQDIKASILHNAETEDLDKIVVIIKSDVLSPDIPSEEYGRVYNAYVAWNNAVENVDQEMRQGVELFSNLTQVLKLYIRQRDKEMMLQMIEEPTTLQLFRDLFTIFYEPLVRVYKSANVYNSVTDFAKFADDAIQVIEAAQRQDVSADPNQTVQAFIDVCARHESSLYSFIHEVHTHDNGLFDQLMNWLEDILEFLREGPKGGALDMNAMLRDALDAHVVNHDRVVEEVNALVKWQTDRKKWHHDKTRQKMAKGGETDVRNFGSFGFNEDDLQDLEMDYSDNSSDEDLDPDLQLDPIEAERISRARDKLRRSAGEPIKPKVEELSKLIPPFVSMLRAVLAD